MIRKLKCSLTAQHMVKINQDVVTDVVREKFVRNDNGVLASSESK